MKKDANLCQVKVKVGKRPQIAFSTMETAVKYIQNKRLNLPEILDIIADDIRRLL